MKKIIYFGFLLLVLSLLFLGCQKAVPVDTSDIPASTEEAEIDSDLSEIDELDELEQEFADVDFEELENLDLE